MSVVILDSFDGQPNKKERSGNFRSEFYCVGSGSVFCVISCLLAA